MNSLAEIINPIVEPVVQACEEAFEALADVMAAAASAFLKVFPRVIEKFSILISKIISPRVVFLAAHAKKNRVRKKNAHRILKAIQKLIRR